MVDENGVIDQTRWNATVFSGHSVSISGSHHDNLTDGSRLNLQVS